MGTEISLVLFAADEASARSVADAVFDECDRVEALLSNYKDSSELSRINMRASEGAVTTDPETFSFLEQAQHWSNVSGGAFDMTVGPLMKLWGFYRHNGRVPSSEEIRAVLPQIGYQNVLLDAENRSVRFTKQGVELDPGGIGKGFAVDSMARIIRQQGISAALISAGSSTIYAIGRPPGKAGWTVIVRMPTGRQKQIASISLRDESLSSANCSEKNFQSNGATYCHIMDPRTGRPVTGRIHVTITHPSATASDALSNVIFVAAPQTAARILHRSAPQSRAIIVDTDRGKTTYLRIRWPGACNLGR